MMRQLLSLVIACTALNQVSAGTYDLPLTAIAAVTRYTTNRRSNERSGRPARWRRREISLSGKDSGSQADQLAFNLTFGPDKKDPSHAVGAGQTKKAVRPLPTWDWEELAYVVVISVGSVPQHTRALLSISDTDLLIPSTACRTTCGPQHKLFDVDLSSKVNSDGVEVEANYHRCWAEGVIMSDHLTMGSISIPDQWFISAHTLDRFMAFEWGKTEWDGVLGLAPSSEHSVAGIDNPLQNMVAQKFLERDVFSMRLPKEGQDGELSFGGTNSELYSGGFRTLKLTHMNGTRLGEPISPTGRWQVSLESISIGDNAVALGEQVAILETDFPLIALPSKIVDNIHYHLGFTLAGGLDVPLSINCEVRPDLPNITIRLDGFDFALSPFEYTLEVEIAEVGGARCLSLLCSDSDFEANNVIILGSAFLRNWYTTFDISSGTVGFAALSEIKQKSRLAMLFDDYVT